MVISNMSTLGVDPLVRLEAVDRHGSVAGVAVVVMVVQLQLLLLIVMASFVVDHGAGAFAMLIILLLLTPLVVGHVPLEDPAYRPYFCILEGVRGSVNGGFGR